MDRAELRELHYITHIDNVPSCLQRGVLCHNQARRIDHVDVSMREVQDIRRGKRLPNGDLLHDYANVYFQARNPMLYRLRNRVHELVVLRIDPAIVDLPGAVIADGNAAVGFTAFEPAPDGLRIVDKGRTYARRWTHQDTMEYRRRKAASCAEVLVPGSIDSGYITGAFVGSGQALRRFRALGVALRVRRNPRLFFLV